MDFGKPELFDPTPLVSDPTPNESYVRVRAKDTIYVRAVQQVVDTNFIKRRTWHSHIHRSFAYDIGMWIIALPAGLILATHYMVAWLPTGSDIEVYRWAFFLYALGAVLIGYRFLNAYVKWAFPVNVLRDNKDSSFRHRVALAAIFIGLLYKAGDVITAGAAAGILEEFIQIIRSFF